MGPSPLHQIDLIDFHHVSSIVVTILINLATAANVLKILQGVAKTNARELNGCHSFACKGTIRLIQSADYALCTHCC